MNWFLLQGWASDGFRHTSRWTVTVSIEVTNKAMYNTINIVCEDGLGDAPGTTFKAEWRTPGAGIDDVMAMEEFAEITEGVDEDLLFEDAYWYVDAAAAAAAPAD